MDQSWNLLELAPVDFICCKSLSGTVNVVCWYVSHFYMLWIMIMKGNMISFVWEFVPWTYLILCIFVHCRIIPNFIASTYFAFASCIKSRQSILETFEYLSPCDINMCHIFTLLNSYRHTTLICVTFSHFWILITIRH